MDLDGLFNKIEELSFKERVIIAIEGGSASGKTFLSEVLADKYNATIIHMDDFFLRPEQRIKERLLEVGGNIDKERFIKEILPDLQNNELKYHKFDCSKMKLSDEIMVNLNKIVIVEGVYSMHPEFKQYYDISVFLDISKPNQVRRILNRNTPEFAKRFFEEWIPLEEKYHQTFNIKEKCDFIVEISS